MEYTQAKADRLRARAARLERKCMFLTLDEGEGSARQARALRQEAQEIEKHLPVPESEAA